MPASRILTLPNCSHDNLSDLISFNVILQSRWPIVRMVVRSKLMRELIEAEWKLLQLAKQLHPQDPSSTEAHDDVDIIAFDTPIPNERVPNVIPNKEISTLSIHAIKACRKGNSQVDTADTLPIVLLHGYGTSGVIYYRNLIPLAIGCFVSTGAIATVYAIDNMGCGLSSRISMEQIKDRRPEAITQVAVDSLEAWRDANGLEKFVLVAHSIAAIHAVAYCQQYPKRVEQLVLLSPAGVTCPKQRRFSFGRSMVRCCYKNGISIASLPDTIIKGIVYLSIKLSLPSSIDEKKALIQYHYANSRVANYYEKSMFCFIDHRGNAMTDAVATCDKISQLKIPSVSLIYGDNRLDFIDVKGGIETVERCNKQQHDVTSSTASTTHRAPRVTLRQIIKARHALMFDRQNGLFESILSKTIQDGRASTAMSFTPQKRT